MTATLAETIARYRAGLAAYNASDEASPAATFEPTLKELEEWGTSATTLAEAIEALRVANGEVRNFDGGRLVAAMVQAAFAYFDSATAPQSRVQLNDIEDSIDGARYRLNALHMAANGIGDRQKMDSIQAVAVDAIDMLVAAVDALDRVRETAGAA